MRHLNRAVGKFGAYKVRSNTLMSGGASAPIVMRSLKNGNVFIAKREYIADVIASSPFVNSALPLNPGLAQTFPWLSQIADSFEKYRWRGIMFEFKSMSSDAVLSSSTSSALGTVVMATQYNPYDTPFTSKQVMENYEYANSCKPSCSMIHPIDCRTAQPSNVSYIRTSTVVSGDLRLYDPGTFQIAVQGMQASTGVIGELWVNYEVELITPKFNNGGALLADLYYTSSTTPQQFAVPTATFCLGAPIAGASPVLPLVSTNSNLGTQLDVQNQTINFPIAPVGTQYFVFAYYTQASTISTFNTPVTTNCTIVQSMPGNSAAAPNVAFNLQWSLVSTAASGVKFKVPGASAGLTGVTAFRLYIIQLGPLFGP